MILESGLGEHAQSWVGIQYGVARFAPVCASDSSRDLGDFTAGQPTDPDNRDLDGFRKAWMEELQPGLARLSLRGHQALVEDSDHMIPYKDPAIIQAIETV